METLATDRTTGHASGSPAEVCPVALRQPVALLIALLLVVGVPAARAASKPVSCLPSEVREWNAAGPFPATRFGAGSLPGIVLGPPGSSTPSGGSTSVASLGHGGAVTLELREIVIEDGPGPDFIVFENPFFIGAPPAGPEDPFLIFAEPGFVEVSQDGVTWHLFPFDSASLDAARGSPVDRTLFPALAGLAGVTPTFTGDWRIPDDPTVWDAAGTGGISGAGGDAFDLADVGLAEARFIRITDADTQNGPAGSAEGFDLDAVVVLHGRPVALPLADADGDGLPGVMEPALYGTSGSDADGDADLLDDGREAAACRAPEVAGPGAPAAVEPDVWVEGESCTTLRWTFAGSSAAYDLVRGDPAALQVTGSVIDLGSLVCLADATSSVTWSCDSAQPLDGEAFFYLVRQTGQAHFGHSSAPLPRDGAAACP